MAEVLILVDHTFGVVRQSTLELVTAGRALGTPAAVWVGDIPDAGLEQLGAAGVETVYHPMSSEIELQEYLCAPIAEALVAVVAASTAANGTPAAMLVTSTFENKEIAARAADLLGSGIIVDASHARVADGQILVEQSVFAGTHEVTSVVSEGIPVIAMKANSIEATPGAAVVPTVKEIAVEVSQLARATKILTRQDAVGSGRPDLAEAQIVVAGGRGVQGDFTALTELADELGAAIGATRVATDEGWIEHTAQIGQTGVTIAPRLYIGAGISGAIHHRAGMQASSTIVAINADAEAPIFEFADYGIVGDLGKVVPQLTAELKRLRSQ